MNSVMGRWKVSEHPIFWVGVVVVAVSSTPAQAAKDCYQDCSLDFYCEVEVTQCLINTKAIRKAIDRLKSLSQQHPHKTWLSRLLAKAYLADGNYFWAQRVLNQLIEDNPLDCESRSWLAWINITQGELDLAQEILGESSCPVSQEDIARWQVLQVLIAKAKEESGKVSTAIETLNRSERVYTEDNQIIKYWHKQHHPAWIEPMSLRFDMYSGYTSNATAGSPSETPGAGPSSALGKFELFGRFVWPLWHIAKPAVEADLKGLGLAAEQAHKLSYLDFSTRPHFLLGDDFPRILIGYKANLLLIGLDDKELFYEAHRGEIEFDTGMGLLAFVGSGRRIFREAGRTRTEFDQGIGGSFLIFDPLHVLFALSGRQYFAVSEPYNQLGATALLALRLPLGSGFYGRCGTSVGLDTYQDSGGERGQLAYGTDKKRSDVLIKLSGDLYSPAISGIRFGLRYEFSKRDSTADEPGYSYDYDEHRVLAGLRLTADLDPWAPTSISSAEHIELNYGIVQGTRAVLDEERIQDLLRQDEAARAGSSCVE